MMEQLECSQCGANVKSTARFCVNCGCELSKLHGAAPQEALTTTETMETERATLEEHNAETSSGAPMGAGLISEVRTPPNPGRLLNLSCPVCGQIDQIQKVKTIISAGTSNTSGLGLGSTLGGLGDLGNLAVGGFFASTSTELTEELAGGPLPNGWPVFWKEGLAAAGISLFCGIAFVQLAAGGGNLLTGVVGALMVWWLWLGIGAIYGFIQKNKFETEVLGPVRSLWAECKTRLNEARFCFRDGVLFDEFSSGDITEYTSEVFMPVELELQKMESKGLITREW